MKTHDFYFDLPQELIAQTPIERRDASRLLVLDKETGAWEHRHFFDLPEYLHPGDCLILNDSRVLPARLLGQRLPGGGACEVLLLIDRGDKTWECLVRPGKKMRKGAKLSFGDGQLTAEVTEELPGGNRLVRFDYEGIFLEVLDRLGKMPLPPYIKEELQDRERYQTVYSKVVGSAAAPTAGLHFTKELLEKVQANRVLVLNVYRSVSREQVEQYLYKMLDPLLRIFVERLNIPVKEEDKQFIIDFYKYGFVGLALEWIRRDMKADPAIMAERLNTIMQGALKRALQRFRTDGKASIETD